MKKFILMAVLAISAVSAFAKTKNDTLVVTTNPIMHCENCENKIKSNIRFVKGTKDIQTSVPNQTVTIIYDSKKATLADYTAAFKKIGFEVTPVSAQKHCCKMEAGESSCKMEAGESCCKMKAEKANCKMETNKESTCSTTTCKEAAEKKCTCAKCQAAGKNNVEQQQTESQTKTCCCAEKKGTSEKKNVASQKKDCCKENK